MGLRISINPRSKRLGQAPLDIAPIMQLQTNWCWAACAQMVTAYYGNDLAAQCDFANWNFSQNSCCVNGATVACNRPSSDPRITAVFSHWGDQQYLRFRAGKLHRDPRADFGRPPGRNRLGLGPGWGPRRSARRKYDHRKRAIRLHQRSWHGSGDDDLWRPSDRQGWGPVGRHLDQYRQPVRRGHDGTLFP